MNQTLSATSATRAEPTTHTVGIEPVTRDMRGLNPKLLNATVMVVERHGDFAFVVTTDSDVFNDRPLDQVAEDYAAGKLATVAAARWPECGWCGWPVDVCEAPGEHARLASTNETSWR